MDVACLIHSLDGGGAERVMAGLASRLARRGHSTTLVTLDDGRSCRYQVDPAVVRVPLDVMSESRTLFEAARGLRRRVVAIREAFKNASPDVALSFCDRTNVLGILAARNLGIPIVVSERSDPAQQNLGRAYEWLRRHTYPQAARVIAQTTGSAASLDAVLRASGSRRFGRPVDVIASAVDVPSIQSDRDLASYRCRIVSIGRLEREKGFDRLIEAMGAIAESQPALNLRILGEGSQRSALESQVKRLHLSERVAMPGWVQPVWPELSEAMIYVLPSRYEGFPSALMEAMAAGVPSIATDCPSGPRAIVDSGRNGLLVDSTVAGIAAGIELLIADPGLRERLGVTGQSIVSRFGWEAMVDRYEAILLDVASGKSETRKNRPQRPDSERPLAGS